MIEVNMKKAMLTGMQRSSDVDVASMENRAMKMYIAQRTLARLKRLCTNLSGFVLKEKGSKK